MAGFMVTFLVGIICVILGKEMRKGNLFSLHAYHTHRVSQEDRIPFGKAVGLGTILIGAAMMAFSLLGAAAVFAQGDAFWWAGAALLITGLAAGLILIFRSLFRYNNGIF